MTTTTMMMMTSRENRNLKQNKLVEIFPMAKLKCAPKISEHNGRKAH